MQPHCLLFPVEPHNASTSCLHDLTPVYSNNTSSPVTMHLRNPWPLIYCCWNERAQAFLSTLWSSDYGNNTHSANTLWNPNSQMILTTVPCDRLKSCYSSVCNSSVWGLNFPHFHVWCVCCCVPAISLTFICTDMFSFRACTPLCHSWPIHHIVPINSDQLTINFYWSYIPYIHKTTKRTAWTSCLDLCSSRVIKFNWWPSHVKFRVITYNTVMPNENNQWLGNKTSLRPVTTFLTPLQGINSSTSGFIEICKYSSESKAVTLDPCINVGGFFVFAVALRPNVGHGLLILEVSRSHSTTHHSW
jgi:hypothetical protein